MIKEKKEKVIDELAANLSKSTIVIATDFRGLPANEMVKLRRQLDSLGIEYRVAKNTLTRFAAEKAGKKQLESLLSQILHSMTMTVKCRRVTEAAE